MATTTFVKTNRRFARFASTLVLILVLVLITRRAQAQEPGSDGLGHRLYPQLGNGGYDVGHYAIDLRFAPAENHITAETTISAIATQDLSSFNLDFYGLTVASVTVNKALANFQRHNSELVITPAISLAAGEAFTVTVNYTGVPETINDPGVPWTRLGWQEWADGFFATPSAPSGAMNWFPSNNHPRDKATFTFRITVPQPLTAAANGVLADVVENDDNTRTFVWQMDEPMPTYLALVAVGDFVEVRDDSGVVPIRNYFPRHTDPDIIAAFDVTAEVMQWLIGLLGPYPFAEYGIVAVPGFPGALETQTLSIFPSTEPHISIVVHELVHQWFGNSATLVEWQDTWIHEGFATYFSEIWMDRSYSGGVRQPVDPSFTEFLETLPAPGTPAQEEIFGVSVYFRGAMLLRALQLEVGDEHFFNILRQFYQENVYGLITSEEFIATAERVSGRELDDFFAGWLYSDTLPELPE